MSSQSVETIGQSASAALGAEEAVENFLKALIQKTRHLDSIVARALLVADFIDSIDPKQIGLAASDMSVAVHYAPIDPEFAPFPS